VDVAIVGAGYTGLWTAYYLALVDPSLRIAVVEKGVAGFGASGRNGGWCSALFAASKAKVARAGGRDGAMALQRRCTRPWTRSAGWPAAEGIDCHYAKGGTVVLARTPVQAARLYAEVDEERSWGFGEGDVRWLPAAEATAQVAATGVLGGIFTPHCAALHPARLVRGLATAVERRGVAIYERTPARGLGDRVVQTPGGRVRAEVVVRATEGYTASLPGLRRALAPVYSLMIATEPLPSSFWAGVGWRDRQTLSDGRHLIIYAQRTADTRIAFGGRGAPYHFGSRIRPGFDREPAVFAELHRALVEMFPVLRDVSITHRWGGPLGIPRDWYSSVGHDGAAGTAWAGGYVGDGVATSNLAGRTLADLICGRATDLTRLPWVGHQSPPWEPEPLRWLGANAGLRLMSVADAVENRTGRASRSAAALTPAGRLRRSVPPPYGEVSWEVVVSVPDSRQITVVGMGTATAAPDAVSFQLGAETRGDSPAAALEDCARALAAMAAVLRERGVPEPALRTGTLTVQPEWQHHGMDDAPRVVGYQASTTLSVTVRDLPNAGSLATAVLSAGGTAGRLHSLQFAVSDPEGPARSARAAAYADGRAKAEQYAELAGVELGELLSLSERVEGGRRPVEMLAGFSPAQSAPALHMYAGKSAVTAVVAASWALR